MRLTLTILFLIALCGCVGQRADVRSLKSDNRPPSTVVLTPNSELLISGSGQSGIQPPPAQPPLSQLAIALQWNDDPDAEGFNIYYGMASHSYDSMVSAATNYCVLTGLIIGAKYFFAVTSISNAVESDFSKEIAATFDQHVGRVMRFYLPYADLGTRSAECSVDLGTWQNAANCFPVATNSDSQDWFLPNPQTTVFYRLTSNSN
jgi:hypothetical protein